MIITDALFLGSFLQGDEYLLISGGMKTIGVPHD